MTEQAEITQITPGEDDGAVVAYEPAAAPASPLNTMQMLSLAVSRGADVAIVKELRDLLREEQREEARLAFESAMASAKAEIPVIAKARKVDFTSKRTGERTNYNYESLGDIAGLVNPILAKHGLSYRYQTDVQNGLVVVTCVVAHKDGHRESNSLATGVDTSGNKNAAQGVASAVTYLQRYTLKASLGLAAGEDDDGQAAGAGQTITDEQRDILLTLASDGGADIQLFCKWLNVNSIVEIAAKDYKRAYDALEKKRLAKLQQKGAA